MKFTKRSWGQFLEIGEREESFDWDIPSGYILFGSCGMAVHKLIKGVWHVKAVNDWRHLSYAEVNRSLKMQEWECR